MRNLASWTGLSIEQLDAEPPMVLDHLNERVNERDAVIVGDRGKDS